MGLLSLLFWAMALRRNRALLYSPASDLISTFFKPMLPGRSRRFSSRSMFMRYCTISRWLLSSNNSFSVSFICDSIAVPSFLPLCALRPAYDAACPSSCHSSCCSSDMRSLRKLSVLMAIWFLSAIHCSLYISIIVSKMACPRWVDRSLIRRLAMVVFSLSNEALKFE